jgi:large subunit ribosomal protein L29
MNIKEMRELPDEELVLEIEKARDKVFRMRFQGKGKDLEKPGELKALKKDIARMFTVLNQPERKARSGGAPAAPPRVLPTAQEAPGKDSAKGEGET